MLNRVKKYFLLSTAILIGLTVLLSSCEASIDQIKQVTNVDINTDNITTGLDLIHTDSGVVKLRLKAPVSISHDDKENPFREFPEGIEIFFYKDRDTLIENYLKANYGINHMKKELSEVRGNVIVVNNQGDTIKTEKMFWDSKNKTIYSDQLVTIIQGEQIIIGENGFEADESFNYYKILNSSGNIKVDEN